MSNEKVEAYAEKLNSEMKKADAKILELEAEMESASADEKLKWKERLNELKGKRDQFNEKIKNLRGAGEKSLDELKKGVEAAKGDMEKALQEVVSLFKKA